MLELTPATITPYLTGRGVLGPGEPAAAAELAGGVSGTVIRVAAGGAAYVTKQLLPKLKTKAEWLSDPARVGTEVACLRLLGEILPAGQVPEVLDFDPANYCFTMTCAPETARAWKAQLMEGMCQAETAAAVGQLLGRIHAETRCLCGFEDREIFLQLRVSPYFDYTANQHPDLAPQIRAVAAEMLQHQEALVHGDFSPKNILVHAGGIILLDCEVAHRGDPAFDLSFCLNHLLLKAVHRPELRRTYFDLARTMAASYDQAAAISDSSFKPRVAKLLACLLLARIDGKSPVEYLMGHETARDCVRRTARSLLQDPAMDLEGVVERLDTAILEDESA